MQVSSQAVIFSQIIHHLAFTKLSVVQVDIFGKCGKEHPCKWGFVGQRCERELLSSYKFYLAFENCHCEDYISGVYLAFLAHFDVQCAHLLNSLASC